MADAWLPEAGRSPAGDDGGPLRGGAPRAVWLASDSDARVVSARSVAADLVRAGRPAHLVWNPRTGEIVQLVPATRAAGTIGAAGREGRACLQIMVVGSAHEPFTATPLTGLDTILMWLDAWGVARRWPAGPPLPPPQSYQARRDRRAWARGGHFGASQVPGPGRPDPGAIDIRRVTGPETPVAPLPRPLPREDRAPRLPVPRLPGDLAAVPTVPAPEPASIRS
ncbi:hypothetical protein BTM25_20770 [Actinomadura rubteroloni]|uniref:Uncharacterized protein n=1 Tax=Actinomadura rubteroloni TaxID=1926885 RepID=A0A2P4URI6_9ACTN|nr:hypothetical protein BTM25_20770 [Actinomadura rubteroloni]